MDDISDVCPKVSQAHLEQLKWLGALGDLPESRQVFRPPRPGLSGGAGWAGRLLAGRSTYSWLSRDH